MLSNKTLTNLSQALLPEVIDYIEGSDSYVDLLMELIPNAIEEKLGSIDEEVKMELSMMLMDSMILSKVKLSYKEVKSITT